MVDTEIVALYWARDERAIGESAQKYGSYCHAIALRILSDTQDAEESVNDTWLAAWNAMPPHRPAVLSAFLGKVTRRLSLKRWRDKHAQKRGGGAVALALEELEELLPAPGGPEETVSEQELAGAVERFLRGLGATERWVFLCRYWHLDSVGEIARRFGFSESKVKSLLFRTRKKLKAALEKEGWLP